MEWWHIVVTVAVSLATTGIGALVKLAFGMNAKLGIMMHQMVAGEQRMARHSTRLDKHEAEIDAHRMKIDRLERPNSNPKMKPRRA
jgi:hypothetical protein